MTTDVFNQKNEKVGMIDLPEKIFAVKWNSDLVHQALLAQLANRRESLAHTKGRGEVAGGGKKPWRQKGTGRARHGSIRSPLWKGGGVTFGPTKEKIYARKINKKMNRLAIFSVLSKKNRENELKVIDNLSFEKTKQKTKIMAQILKNIVGGKINALLISLPENKTINRLIANIKNADALSPYSLNIYDLLRHKNIILEEKAVNEIEKHYK
ncbi:MAG: 50S ribosomal protein L4 [Candidatus Wolfebacteria bacterium GW2011_GWA2_42_10]|uniref:Large ribosomal subunit protein uL4 n=2 Tax=Candidatus Wolfeibacteriota TaxID=1752735 RepID=A0A0G0XMD7_9BACT|nr:MAG: 50S ribosomal protein L4 [Candidatus Wolfebacteria bacterium GW2011_GWB1_41_12]KKS25612.1 MAG: 50S ribosomal protein L4 [Candidatus Wolfebacteria bacterium GW2011_GWA2_42_10]KKT56497.1 MAG: 50S ribosomal protein L4 [Candidatus Wolfebacteria bacterium GW2011_GWA1_44_24]